jgi:uncharacterized protein (TIGR00290 family)
MKTLFAWSSGKDSAWALHVLRRRADIEVVGLLTTMNQVANRVAMHAVREELVGRQAAALGLPLIQVPIPSPCPNERYEAAMEAALGDARSAGVGAIAFGDLYLGDVRRYREEKLAGTGIVGLFPIWGRDTRELSREMVESGLRAVITCVDPRRLDRAFAGRIFDGTLLGELPAGVDPCGENGEFHTFAFAGPMFAAPIPIFGGEVLERDGFVFADVRLARGAPPLPG